jgi:hypothetical protein
MIPVVEPPQLEKDLRLFFGPNAMRFMSLWRARRLRGKNVGFSFTSFLFPQAWLLYRKMYLTAAALTVAPIAIALFFESTALSNLTGVSVSILGGLGPRYYVDTAEALVIELRSQSLTDEEARSTIAEAGGVSRPGAALGFLIFLSTVVLGIVTKHIR